MDVYKAEVLEQDEFGNFVTQKHQLTEEQAKELEKIKKQSSQPLKTLSMMEQIELEKKESELQKVKEEELIDIINSNKLEDYHQRVSSLNNRVNRENNLRDQFNHHKLAVLQQQTREKQLQLLTSLGITDKETEISSNNDNSEQQTNNTFLTVKTNDLFSLNRKRQLPITSSSNQQTITINHDDENHIVKKTKPHHDGDQQIVQLSPPPKPSSILQQSISLGLDDYSDSEE